MFTTTSLHMYTYKGIQLDGCSEWIDEKLEGMSGRSSKPSREQPGKQAHSYHATFQNTSKH